MGDNWSASFGRERALLGGQFGVTQLMGWAKLLNRVFELDLVHCPNCSGELKIIAATLEQPVIEKILTHLRLQARAPPRAPARGRALHAA